MEKLFLYFFVILSSLYSCQQKAPYNETERKLRLLPKDINRVVIYKNWQKMDSMSYLRLKNVESIVIEPEVDSIPSWINHFQKLSSIWSFSESIKYIPPNIGECTSINHLVFDNSKIKEIPLSVCSLSNLESFSIMNNQIKKLPNCISSLKKLKKIDLYNNDIEEIPDVMYELSSLKEITLKGNPLKNPEEIKEKFKEKGIKVDLE